MMNDKKRFKELAALSAELLEVKDLDILLEKILTLARKFVNADAGSIYIREENHLKFSYCQNDTLSKNLPPGKKLIYSTFTIPIDNNTIAGYVAKTGKILNIPDVYNIPNNVPYKFGKVYDKISNYRSKSMLVIPLKNSRGEIMGVLQIINAKDEKGNIVPFSSEDEPFILHLAHNAAMALERAQITRTVILRMVKMAELRDPKETGPHVNRVAAYSAEIYEAWAKRKGIPSKEIERKKDILRMAAMLHDVGKIAIPDAILKKPGKLTPEEYEIMKQHTFLGAQLFADPRSEFDEAAAEVALNHHERWDGKGYPGHIDPFTGKPLPGYEDKDGRARGKKGEEIPLFGRIVAIADVYDALVSKRCYKQAWDDEKAIRIIKEEAGKQFDPEIVDVFLSCLDIIHSIRSRYPD